MEDNHIDRQRYRRILWFFAGIILHLILYDILGGRFPYIRDKVRASRPQRFRLMSRDFRKLAAEMGGVLINLGQFLSARVDVLPPEIIEELVGLQDEVPAEPYPLMREQLDKELGDLTRHFAAIDKKPLAAASLGQVHQAWLLPQRVNGGSPLGTEVVVKVQRPGIENIVRTDLAALQVVAGWAMRYKPIRKRADLPRLMGEFAKTLWEELDYRAEASNAERFSLMFADDEDVVVPQVYWGHSTGRVLTLEKVEGMKIDDVVGMENAGISPAQVSERLLEIYFFQIFPRRFFPRRPPCRQYLSCAKGKPPLPNRFHRLWHDGAHRIPDGRQFAPCLAQCGATRCPRPDRCLQRHGLLPARCRSRPHHRSARGGARTHLGAQYHGNDQPRHGRGQRIGTRIQRYFARVPLPSAPRFYLFGSGFGHDFGLNDPTQPRH